MQENQMPPVAVLMDMVFGKTYTQLVAVAARLGIADMLSDGAKSVEELAIATNTHAPTLYRILRALASKGIFAEEKNGQFILTPLAEPLQNDAPDSVRHFAIMYGSDWHNEAWSNLLHSVQTGETAFDNRFGQGVFEHPTQHPEQFEIFNNAMTSVSKFDAFVVRLSYDFSVFGTVVDVGGGHGLLLAEILKANPELKGIIFDLPHVAAGARTVLEQAGLTERCRVVEGSFFESIPAGGDAYILKMIMHDWVDERSLEILKNCRRAMKQESKLLVIDGVIQHGNDPDFAKILDIEMLVCPGGLERTEAQFRDLFTKAGFDLKRVIRTLSHVCILECVITD